jgi:hypothetical protein
MLTDEHGNLGKPASHEAEASLPSPEAVPTTASGIFFRKGESQTAKKPNSRRSD